MAEKPKVLVAEDDPFQRMSIVDILTMSNYDVTPVENGQQALDQLEDPDNYFDLVLLDLLMPELSGKDVLDAMMQDAYLCKIPVVVMSARNDK
jgi:CheY-like chemotaxis protein